ncbi:helix-turn-helix domain-containing protein [Actinoplanes sp. NBRC 101535]|uniref:helix-turn-helix domain-containing protein n=1 Tax=Actinoplanes sp. NBRC 101535 TaxID=3032196 RepID=UPI002552CD62|nr:helix-turn-helix domain-containing protein [Actinoplanes sp. NBRC 101535]
MPIGRRVAYWRGRRRMSQQVFAERLGKSRSWVDKVERGVRRIDRFSVVYDIADVLQVDVELLLDGSAEHGTGTWDHLDPLAVEEIRAALERYDQMSVFFERPTSASPLSALRRAVRHAWMTYQQARYSVLACTLPKLLRDAQAADSAYANSDEASTAAHLLGQIYQIASSALRKVGEHELSWLAADRSIAVSQRAGDQLLASLASYRVGSALLALGRVRPALEVNVNIADRLASGTEHRHGGHLSVYGMLLLNGAMAAARAGKESTMRDLLHNADQASQELGGDINHYWTCFGPTNVQLHRVASAVELGDGHTAVNTYERISRPDLNDLPPERRARHYLDIARAYTQVGDMEKAGEMLLESDRAAPAEIRCRPLAHEVLSDVLRRTRGTPPAPIAELAEQMGVGV